MKQETFDQIPTCPQRQDSVTAQLIDLRAVANRLGMYDAADAIREIIGKQTAPVVRYGCHCDLGSTVDGQPDGCVIDRQDYDDCVYAKPGMRKEQCKHWRPIEEK